MLVVGTLAGGWLAKRTGNNAFVVCAPPAFAVFGGTFIHATQMAAALPAALLLVRYAKPKYRTAAAIALLVLTVPWGWMISPAFLIAPIVPVAYLAWRCWGENLRATLVAATGAAALAAIVVLLAIAAPQASAHAVTPAIDAHLAEAGWSIFTQRTSTHTLAAWLARVPTWAALMLLLTLLTAESGAFAQNARRRLPYRQGEAS